MLARFFTTAKVDVLAVAMAGALHRSLPVDCALGETKAAARARGQAETRVRKCVDAFAARTRLNVYQKAKLGTRLEAVLVQAGYRAQFSKSFAFDVVRTLASATGSKTA
jgi:hypothetical protein